MVCCSPPLPYQVLYHDGEEEWLVVRAERVVWRMPPSEAEEDGEEEGLLLDEAGLLDSDDSLDVMEAEETDDLTDDDTPPAAAAAARKKAAPKRIRRKLRTRKSRVRRRARVFIEGCGDGAWGVVCVALSGEH